MSGRNRSRDDRKSSAGAEPGGASGQEERAGPRRDAAGALRRSAASALSPGDVLSLQQSLGNQVVQRMLSTRGREQPADAAAAAIDRARSSGGRPLPGEIRGDFERSLGADLSRVRVHDGDESAAAAEAVGARAYAEGSHIHFGAGHYAPDDPAGVHLLAHEVAHTVQQAGSAPARQDKLEVSRSGDAAEVEADRAADLLVQGADAVIAARPTAQLHRSPLDTKMDTYEENYGKAFGADEKVQAVGGHSVVGDKREAEKLIAEIDAQEAGLVSAAEEPGNGSKYANCLPENYKTKYLLQQYAMALTESGGALDSFQPAYQAARVDYGHVFGLAAAFMDGKDSGEKGNIEAAAGALPTGKDNPIAKQVEGMRGNRVFSEDLLAFKQARNLLETDRSAITAGRGALTTAQGELKTTVFAIQNELANATADKKKAELAAVKSDIQEITGTIMQIYEVGEAVLTATQGLGVNVEGIDQEGWSDPSQLDKLKKGGINILGKLGGPKKVIETAVTALNQGKMDGLQARIDAANEEGKLANASRQAAQISAKKSRVTEVLGKLAELMMAFDGHKQVLEDAGSKLAAQGSRSGNPNVAPAIKFLTEADQFLAQVDITIQMGQKQQEAGKEAYKHRGDLNDDTFNPATTKSDDGTATVKHWWKAQKIKGELNWARRFFSTETKPAYYYATRETVALSSHGQHSLQAGGGQNSTQFDIGKAVEELQQQRDKVRTLQTAAQSALGVGGAVANTAVTAP